MPTMRNLEHVNRREPLVAHLDVMCNSSDGGTRESRSLPETTLCFPLISRLSPMLAHKFPLNKHLEELNTMGSYMCSLAQKSGNTIGWPHAFTGTDIIELQVVGLNRRGGVEIPPPAPF